MRTSAGGGLLGFAALFALLALSAATPAWAQGGREERVAVDPYTEGEAKALKRAGYVSFGPFLWADDHTTELVEETLGGVPLLWVETEHFRIGSSLDEYTVSDDAAEKKAMKAELGRLKKRIPSVNSKARDIDPWLRLHLYAQRMEELWTDYLEAFHLKADEFPGPGMGAGPYLGLEDKYCVLLVEKKSSLARYTGTFCGQAVESSYRFHFPKTDTMFFGIAFESMMGTYHSDAALHYAVVHQVVENMTNGFRGYTHLAPTWFATGLSRWFARRVDPRWLLFIGGEETAIRDEEESIWEPRVRARVGYEHFPPTAEMLAWTDPRTLSFADNMIVWSRFDYLMRRDKKTGRALLMGLMAPVPWEANREQMLQDQFDGAFAEATGLDPEAFDEAWCAWVKRNYAKR